eukprot:scaffold51157_cov51-Phaeocystis_antarctica.AAC.1
MTGSCCSARATSRPCGPGRCTRAIVIPGRRMVRRRCCRCSCGPARAAATAARVPVWRRAAAIAAAAG